MKPFAFFTALFISLSSWGQLSTIRDSVQEFEINRMRKLFEAAELQGITQREKSDLQYSHVKSYTKTNPKDPTFILWGKYFTISQLDTLYSLVDRSVLDQMQAAMAHQKMRAALMPGMAFPDLRLKDTLGREFDVCSLKGKVVFINIWASWCRPCRAEMPQLIKIYDKYKDQGLVVIAISLDDDKAKWLNAIKSDSQPWRQFCELSLKNNTMLTKWGISGIPYNFLIDRNGRLIDKEAATSSLDNKIKLLL